MNISMFIKADEIAKDLQVSKPDSYKDNLRATRYVLFHYQE